MWLILDGQKRRSLQTNRNITRNIFWLWFYFRFLEKSKIFVVWKMSLMKTLNKYVHYEIFTGSKYLEHACTEYAETTPVLQS